MLSKSEIDELIELIVELRQALALERGGGTPLSTEQYLELNKHAKEVIMNWVNKDD